MRERRREKWRDFARLVSFLLVFYSFLSFSFPTSLPLLETLSFSVLLLVYYWSARLNPPPFPPTSLSSNPTPLYPIMLRTIKKKRKKKKEKRVERGWLRFDYAFHHHRLHMRSDSSFVFILIPFFCFFSREEEEGSRDGTAALVFYVTRADLFLDIKKKK